MMKEAYAQSVECEEPCEGRLSRTVLWEGEGETPSLYSTSVPFQQHSHSVVEKARKKGLDILRQVSKHTLPFIFRYIAIYVNILFWGCFEAKSRYLLLDNLA